MSILSAKSISEARDLPSLLGMNLKALESILKDLGQAPFRAKQLYEWLHAKEAPDFKSMSNLSLELRESLASRYGVGRQAPTSVSASSDGTKKYLFPARNGKFIESAYIPDADRATLCVSTQVGCKMGCLFCATARQGFQGNLSSGEILNQLFSLPERGTITNLVYMGMGEPLDNVEGTFGSLRVLMDPKGCNMAAWRITLSTIGLPGPLKQYLDEFSSHLAISIHSPFDNERRSLMPIQQVFPIGETLDLLRSYSFSDHRRLSFEYIMFKGINDSPAHALELHRLVKDFSCRVNLIHYHSVPGNDLQGSPRESMEAFQGILKDKGLMTTIRKSRGEDIQAACGLLSTKALIKKSQDQDW